jgi:hypothetical protein
MKFHPHKGEAVSSIAQADDSPISDIALRRKKKRPE